MNTPPIFNIALRATTHEVMDRDSAGRLIRMPHEILTSFWREGKSDREMALAIAPIIGEDNVDPTRMGRWRHRNNLPVNLAKPGSRRRPGRRFYKYDRAEAHDLMVRQGIKDLKVVASTLGCSLEMLYKIRKELGLSEPRPNAGFRVSQERLDAAEELLNEGMSYAEVARTLHMSPKTVSEHFPGRAWTREQSIQHALQVRWGEQEINRAFPEAGTTTPLTRPWGSA